MAWPEHPYVSALMAVASPADYAGAARAITCFDGQNWPVKQLVIVNATSKAVAKGHRNVKELRMRASTLGDLKNIAIAAADGEWCFPWRIDSWYSPDYLPFMLSAHADPSRATVLGNPYVSDETGELVETTPEHAPFFGFFRLTKGLPRYTEEGSDSELLAKLNARSNLQRADARKAFRHVSRLELLRLKAKAQIQRLDKKRGSVCIVQLGRYGDLINILPLALHINNTYSKPYVMISAEFADLFDGVSYVEPFPVDLECDQVNEGMTLARHTFDYVIQTQIWGRNYKQPKLTEGYNKEMWRMGGFLGKFDDPSWRSLFDCEGVKDHSSHLADGRPLILTNLTCGFSSPFPYGPTLLKNLTDYWGDEYQVLDVGAVRMPHVYDLLPLIRKAKVVVTMDTMLLHLASCTDVPIVALVNHQPWLGTICRGYQAARYLYTDVVATPDMVNDGIAKALRMPPIVTVGRKPAPVPKRRVFHAVAKYDEPVEAERERKSWALASWDLLYTNGVIPAYHTDWKRWSQHFRAKSRVPYFKDTIKPALEKACDDDIIMYTNDDIIIHPGLPDELKFYCGVYGAVAGRRCEIAVAPPPRPDQTPEEWVAANKNDMFRHEGRDMFAFTKRWMTEHWDELPDFLIGSTDWDNCMVMMMRKERGLTTTCHTMRYCLWPAEMPLGWTAHIRHRSYWQVPVNFESSPANIHNRKLFKEWSEKHIPTLRFNDKNHLLLET